jgi:hypothetical protein
MTIRVAQNWSLPLIGHEQQTEISLGEPLMPVARDLRMNPVAQPYRDDSAPANLVFAEPIFLDIYDLH